MEESMKLHALKLKEKRDYRRYTETRGSGKMPEIKICGITTEEEAMWLAEEQVEYAGFVVWERSKRYVTVDRAEEMLKKLNSNIKKVAVAVSPDPAFIKEIEQAGFDILQVHGTWTEEAAEAARIPVWRAVNISGTEELDQVKTLFEKTDFPGKGKVAAVLVDAKEYGSGKTFGWEDFSLRKTKEPEETVRQEQYRRYRELRELLQEQGIKFILAGGLSTENVQRGIETFAPDILDVSSGVEQETSKPGASPGESPRESPGKDRGKIREFVRQVRNLN